MRLLGLGLLGLLGSCAWLPPDSPPQKPGVPAGDPDVGLLDHAWVVQNHVLSGNSTLTESDAILMHGRKVDVTSTGYASPFQGTCEGAGHEKRTRELADVTTEVDLAGEGRQTAIRFGLPDRVTEFRLVCNANTRTPPLTIYIAGTRAMTCFSGVCYLLSSS